MKLPVRSHFRAAETSIERPDTIQALLRQAVFSASGSKSEREEIAGWMEHPSEVVRYVYAGLPLAPSLPGARRAAIVRLALAEAAAEGVFWTPLLDRLDARGIWSEDPGEKAFYGKGGGARKAGSEGALSTAAEHLEPFAPLVRQAHVEAIDQLLPFRSPALARFVATRVRTLTHEQIAWACALGRGPDLLLNPSLDAPTQRAAAVATALYAIERGWDLTEASVMKPVADWFGRNAVPPEVQRAVADRVISSRLSGWASALAVLENPEPYLFDAIACTSTETDALLLCNPTAPSVLKERIIARAEASLNASTWLAIAVTSSSRATPEILARMAALPHLRNEAILAIAEEPRTPESALVDLSSREESTVALASSKRACSVPTIWMRISHDPSSRVAALLLPNAPATDFQRIFRLVVANDVHAAAAALSLRPDAQLLADDLKPLLLAGHDCARIAFAHLHRAVQPAENAKHSKSPRMRR
jgi:hypothetical protein